MTLKPISFICGSHHEYRMEGLKNFFVGADAPEQPDQSAAIQAQKDSQASQDKLVALQEQQAADAKTQQDNLDAQIAARRKAASGSGAGRAALLTGNELGVTNTAGAKGTDLGG